MPQPHIFLSALETAKQASRRLSHVSRVDASMPAASNTSFRAYQPAELQLKGTAHHLPSILALNSVTAGTTAPYMLMAFSTTSETSSTMSNEYICGMLKV